MADRGHAVNGFASALVDLIVFGVPAAVALGVLFGVVDLFCFLAGDE